MPNVPLKSERFRETDVKLKSKFPSLGRQVVNGKVRGLHFISGRKVLCAKSPFFFLISDNGE